MHESKHFLAGPFVTQDKNPTEKIEWTVERYRKNWALDTQGRETKQNHNKET
jgi:hypothetical protein